MMNKFLGMALVLTAMAAPTSAQTLQTLRPTVAPSAVQTVVIDYQAQYKQEREKNTQLRAENNALKQQITEFTALGGSRVMAYCENPATSRNTSGASNNCAAAGYNCESVSGLCRTTCQTSDMCTGGFVCDTSIQQCVRP